MKISSHCDTRGYARSRLFCLPNLCLKRRIDN